MKAIKCKCGKPAEHGYISGNGYYWMGCDSCGIYVSAYTTFSLLRRWHDKQNRNYHTVKENFNGYENA